MSKNVDAINSALKELDPRLVPVYTKHGEKAVMVITETALVYLAMAKANANEDVVRSTLNLMVGLGTIKRYADKKGTIYIDAGIGEQG